MKVTAMEREAARSGEGATAEGNSAAGALPRRVLHTMLRVADLERSIAFYTTRIGMRLHRREDYPQGRFTLAFVGFGDEGEGASIELTFNWDQRTYVSGTAFGHIALEVSDVAAACARLRAEGVKILRAPGPMAQVSPQRSRPEVIAFVEDPDGYRIELIEA